MKNSRPQTTMYTNGYLDSTQNFYLPSKFMNEVTFWLFILNGLIPFVRDLDSI